MQNCIVTNSRFNWEELLIALGSQHSTVDRDFHIHGSPPWDPLPFSSSSFSEAVHLSSKRQIMPVALFNSPATLGSHFPSSRVDPVSAELSCVQTKGQCKCLGFLMCKQMLTSIFLYACESWTLTVELQRRIQAMELRCYRKILHISYKDHVTNEEVCAKIQQATGPHEDLLTIVKRRKLRR